MNIRLKRHESFSIREGWFEKALNAITEANNNIFYKNTGNTILGIGTNMVKGLKYWLQASNIIQNNNNVTHLSEFGNLLYRYDQYLEDKFSWQLIHYFLSSNFNDCPIFNVVFNSNIDSFTKKELYNMLCDYFQAEKHDFNSSLLDDDISVFVKSYYNDDKVSNPEDNYSCPLSNLKILTKNRDEYKKNKPLYKNVNYLVVYYALSRIYNFESFDIEESLQVNNSPFKLFCLDKNMFLQYLEEMKKNGLITINKTAGLNIVYFERNMTLEDIFEMYYGVLGE